MSTIGKQIKNFTVAAAIGALSLSDEREPRRFG